MRMLIFCFSAGFMEDFDITPVVIRNANPELGEVAEESVLHALEILLDSSSYPVLVTCKYGRTLTGAVIGCLRKLQRWSLVSTFDEYRRYASTRQEQQHQQFIEYAIHMYQVCIIFNILFDRLFDTDLVIVQHSLPTFLVKALSKTHSDIAEV